FLRGVMRDLGRRGHEVVALEPQSSWSRQNLIADQGAEAVLQFRNDFPELRSRQYDDSFDHEEELEDADVVVVHEWTAPELIVRLGRYRRSGAPFTLLFHDTHHRAVTAQADIASLDLGDYDGILAFGATLRQRYIDAGWGNSVYVWHEAADDALFRPMANVEKAGDLVWVGNWGDDERTAEIDEFLINPVASLGLKATVRGVRYPRNALGRLASAGIRFGGWVSNTDVPRIFAEHRVTVHIPRRPYVQQLPGTPTIRVFEALACGIPLISAPWSDAEHLFRPGQDFVFVRNGEEMSRRLRDILNDPALALSLSRSGLETIASRHTCRHRVSELLDIL
ncbi:MAG: glycosyltransferase, partial [Rhizobium leguminosarum]|nr:glycosyltransferase [Rhizobium leguminosarum]